MLEEIIYFANSQIFIARDSALCSFSQQKRFVFFEFITLVVALNDIYTAKNCMNSVTFTNLWYNYEVGIYIFIFYNNIKVTRFEGWHSLLKNKNKNKNEGKNL